MFRRLIIGAAAAAFATAVSAQQFPVKPVTMIVPWPAGGTTDVTMRALAEATAKYLGQQVIVENKPGAQRHARRGGDAERAARRLHRDPDPDHASSGCRTSRRRRSTR